MQSPIKKSVLSRASFFHKLLNRLLTLSCPALFQDSIWKAKKPLICRLIRGGVCFWMCKYRVLLDWTQEERQRKICMDSHYKQVEGGGGEKHKPIYFACIIMQIGAAGSWIHLEIKSAPGPGKADWSWVSSSLGSGLLLCVFWVISREQFENFLAALETRSLECVCVSVCV